MTTESSVPHSDEPMTGSTNPLAVPAPTDAASTTDAATVLPSVVESTSTSTLTSILDVAPIAAIAETTLAAAPTAAVELVGPLDPPVEAVGHADGPATKVVQARLLQLGFWNAGVDGDFGLTTKQAVMAFQKYVGLAATGEVDDVTAATLSTTVERVRGAADTGNLIEIDKRRQLLFIVRDGKTVWALNTSTGNGLPYEQEDVNTPGAVVRGVALTPDGLWKVDRERPEGWWEGDLGEIYRPKYFRGGIAVHGSNAVPNYAASHGCVRVSVPAMNFIWDQDLMALGTPVWVHTG